MKKVFLFILFFGLSAHGITQQRVPYLSNQVKWDPYHVQVFGKLSPNSEPHSETYHHPSFANQMTILRDLRYRVFSPEAFKTALPSQMFQFKSQYEFSGPRASMILEDSFWTLENFQKLSEVKFYSKDKQIILSYNAGNLATIRCAFNQRIIDSSSGQIWQDYQHIARAVVGDVMQEKTLRKIIIQRCDNFSHLMTHNIQVSMLFTNSARSNQKIYIVGYNQAFVKVDSMSKLKLAFLFSGVEQGLIDEVFGRFSTLVNNVNLFTSSL